MELLYIIALVVTALWGVGLIEYIMSSWDAGLIQYIAVTLKDKIDKE